MPAVWQGPTPILQQDLIGNAQNYCPQRVRHFIPGRAPANVQNARHDLWEGPTALYVFPAVAQQMVVTSSSASDAAAGTGIQQIAIHYLDNNYNYQQEIVTLNGLTGVNTVATNILRINAIHAVRVGSGGYAAGNISITNIGATVTYGYISAAYNTSRQAIFTVPAGMTGYLSHWQGSSGAVTGTHFTQIDMVASCHDGVSHPGIFLLQDSMGTLNSGTAITLPTPIPIPATTDIKLTAISDAANANVTAIGAIMGWYEPTPGV